MFQDPVIVKPPEMDMLASSLDKSSHTEARKTRSGSAANQDPQQALKCPRCDSSNTKFCYFNNYSSTQPRHFCKNCRRYWTKGGTLRNVPVGGGCRKNKRVKQRLMGGVDPTLLEDSTNMLARLTSTFHSYGGSANYGDDSSQMLNIALSRSSNFLDMNFPAMMDKASGTGTCGTCGSGTCGINGTCGGMMSTFENNLNHVSMGYTTLPIKLEHEGITYNPNYEAYNPNYELNTFFDQTPNLHMSGTSATATLASIEDELSSFSNVDSFNPDDVPQMKIQDQKNIPVQQQGHEKLPLQLLNHGEHGGHTITDFPNEKVIMEDKDLINGNGLSLMSTDNWQQSALMNDMFFEPHHNLSWGRSTRWQDCMHALATTTTAGGVL